MRLALYHPWIYLRGGCERVIVETITRSRHDWSVYTHHLDRGATFAELAGAGVVELSPRIDVRRSLGPLARAGTAIAATRLPDDGSRALLVSSESIAELALVRNHRATAAYPSCHTPLKILHDPATRHALTAQSPTQGRALSVIGPPFATAQRRLWRRYRHVFVNSAETAQRVERARLRPSGEVEVLHPGVDADVFTPGPRDADLYFLVAGRVMWQKEIELAIDALRQARERGSLARLVVAGAVDAKSRPYLRRLEERARDLPVQFAIDPTDEELRRLYQGAAALVFTPPSEDFGIVPLEAMAAGTPVMARDSGGPLETVVDGVTGWLLPGDPGRFAEQMLAVERAGTAVEPMRKAARRRALEFSWARLVARIDDVMECLATGQLIPAPDEPTPVAIDLRPRPVPAPAPAGVPVGSGTGGRR